MAAGILKESSELNRKKERNKADVEQIPSQSLGRARWQARRRGSLSEVVSSHHRPRLALWSVLDLSTSMWTSRWVQAAADKGRDLRRQQYCMKGNSQRGWPVEGRQPQCSKQRPNASFSSRSRSWRLMNGRSAWLCFSFQELEAAPPGCQQAPFLGRSI